MMLGARLFPVGERRTALEEATRAMFDEDFAGRTLPFDNLVVSDYVDIVSHRPAAGRPISQVDAKIAAIVRRRRRHARDPQCQRLRGLRTVPDRPVGERVGGQPLATTTNHDVVGARTARIERLDGNLAQRPTWQGTQCFEDLGYRWSHVVHAIAPGQHDEDRNRQRGEVLLILHALVGGDEHVEFRRGQGQERAVRDARSAATLDGGGGMPNQKSCQPGRDGLVKQDAHPAPGRRARLRNLDGKLA